VAAIEGGRTSNIGTLTKSLGRDNRLAIIGTIVVVSVEKEEVGGMGMESSGHPACLRKSNGPILGEGVRVGVEMEDDDNASMTNL